MEEKNHYGEVIKTDLKTVVEAAKRVLTPEQRAEVDKLDQKIKDLRRQVGNQRKERDKKKKSR